MADPAYIVFSASDVTGVGMKASDNTWTGANTFSGAVVLNGALSGTSVKDEDNMASDSATAVPTQQSVKAYVDAQIGTAEEVSDTVGAMVTGNTETFISVTYEDSDNTLDFVVPVKDEDTMASDSDVHLPTQQSVKAYADTKVAKTGDTMTGDLKIQSDSKKLFLGAGDDMTAWYDGTNGNIKTSDVTASDLNIITGAAKTLVLDTVVWDDIRVNPGSFDRPGVTDPTIVAYDVNGGGVSTYLWQFQKNAIASFTIQLPHSYKTGTDIAVHIHWTPGANGATENGNTVGWKIDYSWANINGSFPTMSTADLSDACDGTDHKHQMTPDVTIDGHTAAKGISSMLICNVKRTDTGTDDTWSGTASGALPMLLEIDFHYQIDTIGSRQQSVK